MARRASFDIDLRTAWRDHGPVGAGVEILRACFAHDMPNESSADRLLAELRRSETQTVVKWRQDRVLSPPRSTPDDLDVIAEENQAIWQAAQGSDGTVEIGIVGVDRWERWASTDLGELLCRLLAMEAVVGHGPSVVGSRMTRRHIEPFEVLVPMLLPDGPAELAGVVAGDGWLGVTMGKDDRRWTWAAPVGPARAELRQVAPEVVWRLHP